MKTKTAPVGWVPGEGPGLFDKKPIYLGEEVKEGETVTIETLDGEISYTVTAPSVVCANEKDGKPDLSDRWVRKWADVEKNYIV